MGYYLQFDGINDYVAGDASALTESASSFSVELELKSSNPQQSDTKAYSVGTRSSTVDILLGFQSTGTFRAFVRRNNNFVRLFTQILSPDAVYKVRLDMNLVTGLAELYLDDVLQQSGTPAGYVQTTINRERYIGAETTSSGFAAFGLYGLKEWVDGTQVSYYDPNQSAGTGFVLHETLNNNDGTLINFPLDDSQWVFYGTAVSTPVNLGVTNLTGTSARLTWEAA